MAKDKIKGRFLGPHEVFSITPVSDGLQTPTGGEIVDVKFKNDDPKPIIMPKRAFEQFSTPAPTDHNKYQERRFSMMAAALAELLLEYDIQHGEIVPFLQYCGRKLQNPFEEASNFLWTQDRSKWVPGMSFLNFRTLLEADRILKSMNNGEDAKGKKNKSE